VKSDQVLKPLGLKNNHITVYIRTLSLGNKMRLMCGSKFSSGSSQVMLLLEVIKRTVTQTSKMRRHFTESINCTDGHAPFCGKMVRTRSDYWLRPI